MLKGSKRLFSFALALMLLAGLSVAMPQVANAIDVGVGSGLVTDTSGTSLTGNQVYYGEYGGSPILWRVVAKDASTVTLFCHGAVVNDRVYCSCSAAHHDWTGSDVCAWLNGTVGPHSPANYTSTGFLPTSFSAAERAAIKPQYSTDQEQGLSGNPYIPNQTIVLPSVAEVEDSGTWGMSQSNRVFASNWWWLRSPGFYLSRNAALVYGDGSVDAPGLNVINDNAVRPAFKLNLSSALFTSAAAGGKSGAVGAILSAAQPTTGAVKLTIADPALTLGNLTPTAVNGRTITFDYAAGTTLGKTLSAVVMNGATLRYYSQLEASTAAS